MLKPFFAASLSLSLLGATGTAHCHPERSEGSAGVHFRSYASIRMTGIVNHASTPYSVEDIFAYTRVGNVVPSPDGKMIAYVAINAIATKEGKKWQFDLHLKNGDSDKTLVQLKDIQNIAWSPDNKTIAYIAKGKSYKSIWFVSLNDFKPRKMLELDRDISSFKFSPNGKEIAYVAPNKIAPKESLHVVDLDKDYINESLYLIDVAEPSNKAVSITPADMSVSAPNEAPAYDWSPDGKTIAFTYQARPSAAYFYKTKIAFLDVTTKKITDLAYSIQNPSWQPYYSLDGKWLAFQVSPFDGEKTLNAAGVDISVAKFILSSSVCVMNLQNQQVHCVKNTNNGLPTLFGWNQTSDALIVGDMDKIAGFRLFALPMNDNESVKPVTGVEGFVEPLSITMNSTFTAIGFGLDSPTKIPQAYVSSFANHATKQISDFHVAKQAEGNQKVIQWHSADGKTVEGILITPKDYDAKKKYPLYVSAHGGPAGNWSLRYLGGCDEYENMFVPSGCNANLLSQGFVVLEPNPRGSNAYGLDCRLSPVGDIGGGDYQDVMSGVDYLIQQGIADPNHLAIGGWSYGGYLTNWSIGLTDRFKAAVDGDGNVDFTSFAGTSDIPLFTAEYLGANFWEQSRLYIDRSPIYYTQNIKTPLLIISGEKDLRVPMTQGLQLYSALYWQNKKVKMITLPEQGHVPSDAGITEATIKEINAWLKQAL